MALFLLLDILFLGVRPLFIPDEVRYGEIAREMLSSGNWIVPRLNGLLYFEKPPLGHWLNAFSLYLFGENAFAVRFASAVSSGVSALTVFAVARHFFHNRFTSLFAVFVFLTIFEVQVIATFGVLDSIFSAFLNAGIAVFVLGADAVVGRQKTYLLCAGLLFGLAFLTKGLLAFVLPCLVLVPWLLYRKQYVLLFRRTWFMVGVAVLVTLPWGIAIHQQQPDFWHYFFWVEHIQRFAGEHPQHEQPFYYFLVYAPLVTLPWFLMTPAAATGLKQQSRDLKHPAAIQLLLSWAIMPLIFFSVSSGKLITYILPCMVPFAVIIAAGLTSGRSNSRLIRMGLVVLCLILVFALAALAFAQFSSTQKPLYQSSELGGLAAISSALISAIAILIMGLFTRTDIFRTLACGLAVIPLMVVLPLSLPGKVFESEAPVDFIRSVADSLPPDSIVIANGSLMRAVSWSLQRDDVYVIDDFGEAGYGLSMPDGSGRYLEPEDLAMLLRQSKANGKEVLIACENKCATETLSTLDIEMEKNSYGKFVSYRLHAGSSPNTDGRQP